MKDLVGLFVKWRRKTEVLLWKEAQVTFYPFLLGQLTFTYVILGVKKSIDIYLIILSAVLWPKTPNVFAPRTPVFSSVCGHTGIFSFVRKRRISHISVKTLFFPLVWFSKPKVTLSSFESLHFELLEEEVFCWSGALLESTLGYHCTNLDLLPMHILFSTFKIP